MADWRRCWEGSQAWTDGVRSEEGWRPSHGGKERSRRQVSGAEGAAFRGGGAERPHPSRSRSRSSRELLENEELHGPDQITLHDK